ncbi:sodium-dependent phosphate transporter 2 isoform X2 [Cimex lectularius]|uniref:Phosphate transporter n=1 Tax=Cimex lectularius TaxID=79782 RepID=A0A8I6RKF9_CIMLE|nr:sodium-dependent phosphate transporter 2 isoform X2 [Cimex lectularius]
MEEFADEALWLVIVSFIVAFVLAFGIGANDVANSFGTSVGSKVLTVRSACILATIFEMAGAILIGYKVSDTMRKGILDLSMYNGQEMELMLGCLSSLIGSGIWLIAATFLKLPISGTHSIVGATVGFSLVCRGTKGLKLQTLGTIIASWFISPVMSGIVSVILYKAINVLIINAETPLTPALRALPFFYMATISVNIFSIVLDGPKLLYLDNIPLWLAITISLSIGLIVAIGIQLFMVPWQRRQVIDSSRDGSPRTSRMMEEGTAGRDLPVIIEVPANNNGYILAQSESLSDLPSKESKTGNDILSPKLNLPTNGNVTPAYGLSPNSSAVPLIREKTIEPMQMDVKIEGDDSPEIARVFSFLQVLTASFGSFAHGGNDVSNAIGPLIAVWLIYIEGTVLQKSETPLFILIYGGIGIAVGLWIWGRRVIKTIGEDLTKITPSTGFTIEIGAAFTVLIASKIGIPISTTHCKVGSVVFVGWVSSSSSSGVDWHLFRNIIFAWVVTVPVAGLLSGGFMAVLRPLLL